MSFSLVLTFLANLLQRSSDPYLPTQRSLKKRQDNICHIWIHRQLKTISEAYFILYLVNSWQFGQPVILTHQNIELLVYLHPSLRTDLVNHIERVASRSPFPPPKMKECFSHISPLMGSNLYSQVANLTSKTYMNKSLVALNGLLSDVKELQITN